MSQEIVFTTLPNGRTEKGGSLRVSVFTTIQVKVPGNSNLGAHPDLLNWPDIMLNGQYRFQTGPGTYLEAVLDTSLIDKDLYKSVFHKDIRLKGYLPENFSQLRINSFPARQIKDYLLKNYVQTAIESPTRFLTADHFIDDSRFGVLSRYRFDDTEFSRISNPQMQTRQGRTRAGVSRLLVKRPEISGIQKRAVSGMQFTPTTRIMNPVSDFASFRNFHRMDKWKRTSPPKKIEKPEFEFHEILSILNNYPQLMRKMGFVLDLVIKDFPKNLSTGSINLVPSSLAFAESDTVISVPATAFALTNDGFFAEDKADSVFARGFVKINTDDFSVVQVDADGVAVKAHNLAENKAQEVARYYTERAERKVIHLDDQEEDTPSAEPPSDEGLPFIRTAGIAVTRTGMAEQVYNRIQSNLNLQKVLMDDAVENKALVPGLRLKFPDNRLFSSDLIQGYRMDIAYESNPDTWYSLHRRKDSYAWYDESGNPHPIGGIVEDEGFIELGMAEDPDDPTDVFVSDTLARWEGWSLSVGKPGLSINHADDSNTTPKDGVKRDFVYKDKASEMKKYAFDPDLHFNIHASSKIVPGSLPKLRFGKSYRIRIRTVDLAGNSLPLTAPTQEPARTIYTNIRYLRYEPLASPIVLVGNELKDGEFLERLVIRSNYDQTVEAYENKHPLKDKHFEPVSQRYLLPPKNSQSMAETHGMLEKAFSGSAAHAAEMYSLITAHEGTYDREENTVEKVYQPDEVEVIYLPDPMAAGVAFFVAEGSESTHTQDFFKPRLFSFFSNKELAPGETNLEIPEDWYHAKMLRIRLQEGEPGTDWNSGDRIFTIFLPKGLRTRIRFSTFWREQDFKQLSAIWDMVQGESPAHLSELEMLMRTGRHWMISPSREFELVHAVQQPVEEPVLQALIPQRDFDDTDADIHTRFSVHGESTDKVEIQCRWTEPVDDGISVSVGEKGGRNTIPDLTIHYHDDVVTKGTIPDFTKIDLEQHPEIWFQPRKDFRVRTRAEFKAAPQPGARHINTHYKAQAEKHERLQSSALANAKTVRERLRFDIETSRLHLWKSLNLRIQPLKQHFGDTRHRWVDYSVKATTRYREYFDKLLAQDKSLIVFRESPWIKKVNILSTARPKAPEIDYVIPTFEWRRTQDQNTIVHHRLGGGLRVYLKRPWYSSGADELLGVILPPAPKDLKIQPAMMNAGQVYTPYFTHWGLDPLHLSTPPGSLGPASENFRLRADADPNLQYPGQNGLRAQVVGFPVEFDQDRQLWFSDLAVNPGNMYFPFIRLVLCRYQPHSVRKGADDVCLSPVVLSDMIQLMPDRKATLVFKNDEKNSKFILTLEGVIYNSEGNSPRVTDSGIRISFIDNGVAQPLYGLIDDGTKPKNLTEEGFSTSITARDIQGNRFSISHEFTLPKEYREAPFEILIREFEAVPSHTKDVDDTYSSRLERSAENEKLVYADVFKINGKK